MRTLTLPVLAAGVLAACSDGNQPAEPSGVGLPGPELSVVVFGITELGPAGEDGVAHAVNDLGQVAGDRVVQTAPDRFRAWLRVNGVSQDLPTGSGPFTNSAADINAAGVVVGIDGTEAAAWDGGVLTTLPPVFNTSTHEASASGINDLGQIVGSDFDLGQSLALFWEGKADPEPAILPSPDGPSEPLALNDAGVIVGVGDVEGLSRAQIWERPSAAPQPLKGFDGGTCSDPPFQRGAHVTAEDINQLGAIVGACFTSDDRSHAAYWPNKDAVPIDLDPGSHDESFAAHVNELGQIAGSVDGQPVLWMREGNAFRRFDLGTTPEAHGGIVLGISNTGYAVGSVSATQRRAALWHVAVLAELDAVPGDPSNRVKLDGRGRVSVAILGSRWLQAAGIDPQTLTLGNDDGQETPVAQKKKLTPAATLTDVNRDGFPDLVAEFDKRQMMLNGDLAAGTPTLILLGRLKNGKHIRGADLAQVAP